VTWKCCVCGKPVAELPQWCYVHRTAHEKTGELTLECSISFVCYLCNVWMHDECGLSPGFVHKYAQCPFDHPGNG